VNITLRIEGRLDPQWSDWFEGLAISHLPDGSTQLTGQVIDQPALYETISTHVLSLDDFNICCEFKLLFPLWLWHKRFVRNFSRHTI
jgi:hypothetical protein